MTAAAALFGWSASRASEPQQPATAASVVSPPSDGAALYLTRCAGCHENPQDRTPSREVLSQTPPSFIFDAMDTGIMVEMSVGLSEADKRAIASHVSRIALPAPVAPVASDPDPNAI